MNHEHESCSETLVVDLSREVQNAQDLRWGIERENSASKSRDRWRYCGSHFRKNDQARDRTLGAGSCGCDEFIKSGRLASCVISLGCSVTGDLLGFFLCQN